MQIEQNEQTEVKEQTETVETEKNSSSESQEVSLGKFKDAKALLSAYNSLQAEFTKRCQRVKELESEISIEKAKKDAPIEENNSDKHLSTIQVDKDEILKDYLKELLSSKQQAIIMDNAGMGIVRPPVKPKTFAEAGMLAKDLLNKNNN